MPIYEFRCAVCGQLFEKLCPMGETGENIACPNCGKPGPRRVMSSFCAHGKKSDNGGSDLGGGGGGGCAGCSSTSCATCGH